MNAAKFTWPPTEQLPPLLPDRIQVCVWDLDPEPAETDWNVLSEEEIRRARRFVYPRDRDRYVRAHTVLHRVLGEHAGVSARAISFVANEYGKPEITSQTITRPLHFNLSHSAGVAVLAVSRSYPLGVDIELLRPMDAEVAEHHFSGRELFTLRSLRSETWLSGFYRCWTSKEALLKGEGLGLNVSLSAFDVEVDPQLAPALLAVRAPTKITHNWRLVDLKPGGNAIGTLAVRDDLGSFKAEAVECFSLHP